MQLLMRVQIVILHLILADNPLSAHRTHLGNLLFVFEAMNAISPGHLECILYILSVDEDPLVYLSIVRVIMLIRGYRRPWHRVRNALGFGSITLTQRGGAIGLRSTILIRTGGLCLYNPCRLNAACRHLCRDLIGLCLRPSIRWRLRCRIFCVKHPTSAKFYVLAETLPLGEWRKAMRTFRRAWKSISHLVQLPGAILAKCDLMHSGCMNKHGLAAGI